MKTTLAVLILLGSVAPSRALLATKVVSVYDPRLVGPRTEAVFVTLSSLPTDYYRVEVSTK